MPLPAVGTGARNSSQPASAGRRIEDNAGLELPTLDGAAAEQELNGSHILAVMADQKLLL